MAKYTIDIPDELIPYMTENLPSAPAYIRAVLLKPLLQRFENDERLRILATPLDELDQKLSDIEKGAKIKKEKKSMDDSALEETHDLPSVTETPKIEPVIETPAPQQEAIVEVIETPKIEEVPVVPVETVASETEAIIETFEAPTETQTEITPAEEPAPVIPA